MFYPTSLPWNLSSPVTREGWKLGWELIKHLSCTFIPPGCMKAWYYCL